MNIERVCGVLQRRSTTEPGGYGSRPPPSKKRNRKLRKRNKETQTKPETTQMEKLMQQSMSRERQAKR